MQQLVTTERVQQLGSHHGQFTNRIPTQTVAQVTSNNGSRALVQDKTPEKPPKVNVLTEVRELKAELTTIQKGMAQQSHNNPHLQYNPAEQGRA